MATKLHKDLTDQADLHPNKIDGTTGTELTPASQATYDGRYVRTIGGTITPTTNGTGTVTVNRQDGTTAVLVVDTTNNRVQVGNGSSGTLKVGDANISKAGGSNWSMGGTNFSGAIGLALRTVTTNYTMSTGADCMVLADATSGVVTVTLPSAGGLIAPLSIWSSGQAAPLTTSRSPPHPPRRSTARQPRPSARNTPRSWCSPMDQTGLLSQQ